VIVYLGELSIGAAVPGANAAVVAGLAGINLALPDILARIAALQAFVPTPVDFGVQLILAQQMVTSVGLAISLGLPVPSILLQIAAIEALILALLATIEAINGQLDILVDIQTQLATSGLHAYAYAGTVGALGGEVTGALASGLPGGSSGDAAHALVFVTTTPATWSAMSLVFKVSP